MPKKVLLCDDDPGIVESVRLVLELKGLEVKTVIDGEHLVAAVLEYQPDIILLDLWLSGLSGETITHQLKNQAQTKSIPVIILSANQATPQIATRIGADGFLCKPFDIDELELVIKLHTSA